MTQKNRDFLGDSFISGFTVSSSGDSLQAEYSDKKYKATAMHPHTEIICEEAPNETNE